MSVLIVTIATVLFAAMLGKFLMIASSNSYEAEQQGLVNEKTGLR